MNLTIDIGNSSIKLAVFSESKMVHYCRIEGHDFGCIKDHIDSSEIDKCIVSSTVTLDENAKKDIENNIDCNVVYLNSTTPIPVKNLYKSPKTLGTDRLAAAIGAYGKVKNDVLVIDMGTAITYDFVNKEGEYLGGNISAGMEMRFKALHDYTSKLPLVIATGNHPELGEDTDSAIRCGVIDGIKYEIEGYIHKFLLKYPNLSIFFTGGDELYFENEIKKRIFADNYLVVEGLNDILSFQETNKKG